MPGHLVQNGSPDLPQSTGIFQGPMADMRQLTVCFFGKCYNFHG